VDSQGARRAAGRYIGRGGGEIGPVTRRARPGR